MISSTLAMMGKYGPQWVVLVLLIIALWQSGALKAIFNRNGTGYVLREDCHKHVDSVKDSVDRIDKKIDLVFKKVDDTNAVFIRHLENHAKGS